MYVYAKRKLEIERIKRRDRKKNLVVLKKLKFDVLMLLYVCKLSHIWGSGNDWASSS